MFYTIIYEKLAVFGTYLARFFSQISFETQSLIALFNWTLTRIDLIKLIWPVSDFGIFPAATINSISYGKELGHYYNYFITT